MSTFKYTTFKWLARMDGFGYPVDVHYGSIFLGTLECEASGVFISLIQTPLANITVSHKNQTPAKTVELAAQRLLVLWRQERSTRATA